jgi:hypothetical protein
LSRHTGPRTRPQRRPSANVVDLTDNEISGVFGDIHLDTQVIS